MRMPVMAGAAFTAVTPMILIAGEYGIQAVYGSMLAAARVRAARRLSVRAGGASSSRRW
ncbi:hypothetical protein [Streptomyces sp. KL116D]|uniref:hypothetical protein n=1 Tax=Streptomyces sp. KL116D TaxID=3045152 RepID=UPI003558A3EA